MVEFEQAFAGVEEAAQAAAQSAVGLAKLARQLEKAAKGGNIAAMKKAQGNLAAAIGSVGQATDHAANAWRLADEDEQDYLRDGYAAELRRIAQAHGLSLYERDGRLIASPSIVKVLPNERAVRIDRKRLATIRPSALVNFLRESQTKRSAYTNEAFLEALHKVYREVAREAPSKRAAKEASGLVIPLLRVYTLLTSLPGSDRNYTRMDFARDLYLLDRSGVVTTRSSAAVSFHASTGARSSKADMFTFVDQHGQEIQYYGIRFTGGRK